MTTYEDALLDSEEQEIEDKFESLTSLPEAEKEAMIASLRGASIRRPVTLRMEETDLEAIRRLAEREGMPYQTLIGSVVHKFVSGALVDINEVRKVIKIKA
jgi:predicted DNA binding CopG/RHH family protein